MALQLPERGAPPSNWASSLTSSAPITSSASTANTASNSKPRRKNSSSVIQGMDTGSKTRTARPPASPFIVSGKGKAVSSSSSGGHHHHAVGGLASNGKAGSKGNVNGSKGSSQDIGLQEIAAITDTRRLEDMLAHSDSLVSNPTLCAMLPGGIAHVQARNQAMRSRLAHLYAMREINLGFQDGLHLQQQAEVANPQLNGLDNPGAHVKDEDMEASMEALSIKRETLSEVVGAGANGRLRHVKKEESQDDNALASVPRVSSAIGLKHSPPGSEGSPTPLSFSPPFASGSPTSTGGGFHRNWKNNIANNTRMVGRIGQLSMDESLGLLQQRVNTRLRAEAEETGRLATSEGGRRNDMTRSTGTARSGAPEARGPSRQQQLTSLGDMQIASSAENDIAQAHTPEEERDDFDWHTEGYYQDDDERP